MALSSRSFALIVGTRPNFVKAAPLLKRFDEFPDLSVTLIHTGQHYDKNMSDVFFEQMQIKKPDAILDANAAQSLGGMIRGIQSVLETKKPNGVIVLGDVDSTLAGATAAITLSIPLIHVEAGLRSNDKRMPEEKNRIIVDHLSSLLFTTEETALENLTREGIPLDRVYPVGNLMIESLELFKPLTEVSPVLDTFNIAPKSYFVATVHRSENTTNASVLKSILGTLQQICKEQRVILPLHPGTRNKISEYGYEYLLSGMYVCEPLSYFDFVHLVTHSTGVITDSGGLQEEATHLRIPCATLRDSTERPVTLTRGTNKLFPLESISSQSILEHLFEHREFEVIPSWDGEVSKRILTTLNTEPIAQLHVLEAVQSVYGQRV